MSRLIVLFIMLSCYSMSVRAAGTVNAADYGITAADDATPALLAAIEACHAQGADRLVIPAGVYQMHPNRAFQKYCAISNNDNGMKHIAMPLIGFDGLTVDGQGAELILHGQMMAIDLEDSKNVVIENLKIDWAQPLNFQGTVVDVNEKEGYFELETLTECNVSIEGSKLVNAEIVELQVGGKLDPWWTPWRQDLSWSFLFDGETKSPVTGFNGGGPISSSMLENPKHRTVKVGPNRYRLYHACRDYPEAGMVLVAKGMLMPNRISPAIRIFKSFGVTLRDVTVYHAGAMGLIAERAGDVTMERFAVRIRPGSERVVSTTADATHFVGCKGLIRFEACHFENMLDDATNVHGTYTRIEKRTGPRTVLAKLMHFQQFGFVFAEAGDRLRFSSRESLVPYVEATATAVHPINGQYMEITFDRNLDDVVRDDSILDNLSWQAAVHMSNTTVSRNRARSILISTAGDVLIENNTFDRSSMMNILLEGDAYVWHESCAVRQVRIVGNRFIDRNGEAEMIRISPKLPDGMVPSEPYHRNIVIEDNTFETLSPHILVAAHSADLVFRNNRIEPAEGFVANGRGLPSFVLENCHDVIIEGNTSTLPDELTKVADARSTNVKFSGNGKSRQPAMK